MDTVEKEEIEKLPEKYKPLGAWAIFGYGLLFSIPIAGLICAIVFAFNNTNIVRRNLARAFFCEMLIAGIILAVTLIITLVAGVSIIPNLK